MKKSLKRILCAILVATFVFSCSNVAFAMELKYPDVKLSYPKLYNSTMFDATEYSKTFDVAAFNDYVVSKLKTIDAVEKSATIDISEFKIPVSEFMAIEYLVWYNSPELFNINGLGFGDNGSYYTTMYFTTNYTKEEYTDMHAKMVENAGILLYDVKGNDSLSDVEKALILHDRLVVFNEYDYENYRNNTIPQESYNAYGALGLGTSVCMGYAFAYDYLLEQVGIDSDYCSSDVLNHAWNIVYIDDKPYHVDVTWDDPVWDVKGRVYHDNFLRSTQGIISTDHIGDDGTVDFTTAPVDTTYDNYFWQNSNASFEVVGDKIYYKDDRNYTIYAISDINDVVTGKTKEIIVDASEVSYSTKIGRAYGLLYFSGDDAIYSYNPVSKETIVAITPSDIAKDKEKIGLDYKLWGMRIWGCELLLEYYDWSGERTNVYLEKNLHEEATEWTVVTPATATTKGEKILKCTKCDEILKTEEIPAVGEHTCNWSDWETVVTATCAKVGKKISVCTICKMEKSQSIQALKHEFAEYYTIQATCNATGLKYEECSVCKTKVTLEIIPATKEHKASDTWIIGKVATCGSAGYEYLPCDNCGTELKRNTLDQLKHGETEIVGAKNATCSVEGYTGDTRCKACKTITIYGETIPKNNHTDSGWITKIPATFTVDGLEYRKCTVCNTELETRIIPKKEHSSDGGKITKPSTCTETGVKTYKCTKCGEVIKTEVIPTTGHTVVAVKGYAATCVKTGLTDGTKCSKCNTVITPQQIVPVTAHTVVAVKGYAATCVKPGFTDGTKCSTCNTVIAAQKIIPATGKHVTTLVGHKPATFEAAGHTGKEVCTVCTQTINQGAVIPKLTFVTPTVTVTAKNNGINVSWNAVENAQSYIIYRRVYNASTKKWSGWTKIKTGYALNSYVDSSVVLGTNYRYTVRAVNGNAMSAYTSTGTIKYDVTPTVKVANATNGIKVSWNTAVNATGYRVYRSTYSNGKWSGWKNMGTAKATATVWTDKNVKTNVSYKYTVRAVYNKVLSSYNKSGASVKFLTTPTVKIANASNGIKVSWNKITGATSYVVYSSQYNPTTNKWSSWANRGTVNATNWVDKTTQSGVTYKYTVRAVNGKSLSAYVGSSGLMFLAQPTVTIANASNGIKVTWSQSAGATGYTVYSSTYDAKTKKWSAWSNRGTTKATTKSWVDTKVKSGTSYKYTVRAVNGSVKSTYVSTSGMIFLAQPVFSVNKGANANVISWNKVSGATGYRVYRKANTETNWTAITTIKTTSYTDSNVNNDGVYTYTVRAYNGKVWSSYNKTGITINRNYKQSVLALVNAERAKAGLSPLEYYNNGQVAADIRANEVSKKFSHERPDGTTCFTVFEAAGISYYSAGENIALGHTTPEIVMNAWMNSQGHKANILNPNFTHIIVGYDAKTNSWVQLFLGNPYTK